MSTTIDTLHTQFTEGGHGKIVSAFSRIGSASTAMTAAAAGVAFVAGATVGLGIAALRATARMQTLQARLDSVFGASAGRQAMGWIQTLSKSVPESIDEIANQVNRLQSLGLDPGRSFLPIANAAAAVGPVAEGIDRITLSLSKMAQLRSVTARDVRMLLTANLPAGDIFRAAGLVEGSLKNIGKASIDGRVAAQKILDVLKEMYGGSLARQADTLAGKMQLLANARDRFLATVGAALAPGLSKILDGMTKWLDDKKNIARAVRFFATIAAAAEAVGKTLKQAFDSIFESKTTPRWVLQIEAGFLRVFRIALRISAALASVELITAGVIGGLKSGNPVVAAAFASAGVAAALGVTGAYAGVEGVLGGAQRDLSDRIKKASGPGLKDFGKNFSGGVIGARADALTKGAMAGLHGGTAPGGIGGILGGAGASGISLADQIILGGGARARRGVKATELGFSSAHHGGPPTIRIETSDNSPIGKAMQDLVMNVWKHAMASPQFRNKLKADLAAY